MKILLAATFGFICSLPAWPQTEHGTVVVVFATNEDLSVAADSRGIIGGRDVDDNVCKISTLDRKLIIGIAGIMGQFDKGKQIWDALAIAKSTFAGVEKKPTSDIAADMATAWGAALKNKFTSELITRRDQTLDAIRGSKEPDVLATGFIGGVSGGRFSLWMVKIRFSVARTGYSVRYTTTQYPHPEKEPELIAFGRGDIAGEAFFATTPRGSEWARQIRLANAAASPRLRNAIAAIRAVELSIKYLPIMPGHSVIDVGGPIDTVKMARNGTIDWIQRKLACKD